MCFSATGSFGAGILLCSAGIITLKKSAIPSQMAFAAIPLFFGIQQLSEGFVWLSLTHLQYAKWQSLTTYVFSFFSHILWPVWVAFAVLLFEHEKKNKRILFPIFMVGLLLSLCEAYFISAYGVEAKVEGRHIDYYIGFPRSFMLLSEIVYGFVTIVPCFVCSHKPMRFFAMVLIISIIVADFFYHQWLISVWCFLAAILSIVVYYIIYKSTHSNYQ